MKPCVETALALQVGGVVPFSATDYPGMLSAVIFVQGCPWRCGYCHNPHLQTRGESAAHRWADVSNLLKRRRGLLDAVVFSGGEPCTDPALPLAIHEAKAWGFKVGLHTAGIYPRRLAEVLPLLDWVGLDIKTDLTHYPAITGISGSGAPAFDSAMQVLASGVAYEFRTTVHPQLHSQAGLIKLANTLQLLGVRNYALQEFRATGCANGALNAAAANMPHALTSDALTSPALLAELAARFETFTFRPASTQG